jgi:hypothetical protein
LKKDKKNNVSLIEFLMSMGITSIIAGMVLDGGEVSIPAIRGTWIVSSIIPLIILSRRSISKLTRIDGYVILFSPPIVFITFLVLLPLTWHFKDNF